MASSNESYIIVGAGISGASTAIHLKQAKPRATVTLLDRTPFPNPSSASHDVNKIVRSDYADHFYMNLALEADKEWKENPRYRKYYHPTGMAFAENSGTGNAAIENFKALGGMEVEAKKLSLKDARARWNGIFKNANWDGADDIYWNPKSGWAEATGALLDTINEAISQGVNYCQATVLRLILDDQKSCTGVHTQDGEFHADHIILCTGAFTAKLLADTAPSNKELQVSGRLVAAGAVSCTAVVNPESIPQFKDAPVFFNGLIRGECVPVDSHGRLKFNCEDSFTRMEYHAGLGQDISVPPEREIYSTWGTGLDVPKGLRDEVNNVVLGMFGKRLDLKIESFRMCWDSITPTQDFLISKHPYCKNLFIAAGGSFHGFKFLPIFGKYVVKMIDGTLEKEHQNRWAWDKKNTGAACAIYAPKRDISDVEGSDIVGK